MKANDIPTKHIDPANLTYTHEEIEELEEKHGLMTDEECYVDSVLAMNTYIGKTLNEHYKKK